MMQMAPSFGFVIALIPLLMIALLLGCVTLMVVAIIRAVGRQRQSTLLGRDEEAHLMQLTDMMRRMEERIGNLETILEARQKQGGSEGPRL